MAHIHYLQGDIFESNAQVIVNTVNCEGYMGKGLALLFKQKYPAMFTVYKQQCDKGKLRIGRPMLYRESTPWILNFPTKNTWRANSKLEYLEKGLRYFAANYKAAGIESIAFPKLGAQNGKLSWDDVGPLMAKYLSKLDINVFIYIAEGDHEYYDNEQQAHSAIAWQCFNEIALSLERLQKEVKLSPREAKKVFEVRIMKAFLAPSDIDTIDGLAKISFKRIHDYIQSQQYKEQQLPGIQPVEVQATTKRKSISKRKATVSTATKDSPVTTTIFSFV